MLFSLLMGIAVTGQAKDQDVQVDILMARITSAFKENRVADALPTFAQLEGMEPSLGKPLPENYYYYNIVALEKSGNTVKALSRADIYLNKFGKNGKNYSKVVEIISRLKVQVDKDAEAERKRKQAEEGKGYVSQGGLTWMAATIKRTWAEANSYCDTTAIRGLNGWRLPTKNELSDLLASGALKGQGWTLADTWSSTPGSGGHYGVGLVSGLVFSNFDTSGYDVTCVR